MIENEEQLRARAREQAQHFLEHEKDFRLGDIEAEQSHPLTRDMSRVFSGSVTEGLKLLISCDELLVDKLRDTLKGAEYAQLEAKLREVLTNGGRVILSGCGSSGRLCMRLENSFRLAVSRLGEKAARYENAVMSLMTGGDYAVIRAVECFEDFAAPGRMQAREFALTEKDLLIGITATGETTSILGTAAQALDDGASVFMVVCSQPDRFYDRLPRAKTVYRRERSDVLFLPCGPMALTGSTRMQSSTYEQAAVAIALDRALHAVCDCDPMPLDAYADAFADTIVQMKAPACLALLAQQVEAEKACYEKHGRITYFADEYLLDVLTDTTERSPTFMTPPFVSRGMTGQVPSWAFVKNPVYSTRESWTRCFRREPRCIEWGKDVFAELGISQEIIDRLPPIGLNALCEFEIGSETAPEREQGADTVAVWVGATKAPAEFDTHAARYAHSMQFTFEDARLRPVRTDMDIFEHLMMKMLLNDFSTATMVCMERVSGNWMTFLNISNKKLVDRAARIISLLCHIPYEQAMEELYYTEALLSAKGENGKSSTQETLRRLGA